MWGFFFTAENVTDYAAARRADIARFGRFFHACLDAGVYLPPSAFEACFVSLAHDAAVLAETTDVIEQAFSRLD
jgi:glutamate-1-semialdehyde 2,1-aminomutase